jgi:hypothetical protein
MMDRTTVAVSMARTVVAEYVNRSLPEGMRRIKFEDTFAVNFDGMPEEWVVEVTTVVDDTVYRVTGNQKKALYLEVES